MEKTTVAIFWGSILAQYLWYQKEYLYDQTKKIVKSAAQTVWNKTLQKVRDIKDKKKVDLKEQEDKNRINHEETSNNMNQEQEAKNKVNKQKKIKKSKTKPPKNLRKSVKRYEDWFLQNKNTRKMSKIIESASNPQDSSLKFKRQSCEFDDNMKNYNIEQIYEEYCDQNDEQYNNGNILGYNPIVSDDELESGSCLNNFATRSSQ